MEELLTTKFFIPQIQPHHIPRPELIKVLNKGLHGKLTLVSAPAGFGKTMLISEWIDNIKSQDYISAWISLEKTENDSGLFLSYLVGSLMKRQAISSTLGNSILNIIKAPEAPLREAMIALLNEIADSSCKNVLVLDDFHVIDSPEVHGMLKFLVEHLPPSLHLVIVTRDDPPLPLARFRAHKQLTEIRAAELRFTLSQTARFFNSFDDLDLSPEEIGILEDRSEGWIVGMQLAALSLKGRADIVDLKRSFTGNNRYILDYLITEVLDRQTDIIRKFLLKTSILNQFTGELCNSLTGQDNSHEILDYLVKTNLFIVPLDVQGHWYRYHHLFSDLLRMNLSKDYKREIKALRLRASQWFEDNDYPEEAIDYSLQAEDYQKSVQLLTKNVDDIMIKGKYSTVWQWLIEIPENYILSIPELSLVQAWKSFTGGHVLKAEEYLQAVEKILAKKESKENVNDIRGRTKAIRAFLDSFRGDVPSMIKNTREALSLLSPRDLAWRSIVSMALGDAYGMTGEFQKAFEIRLQALEESNNSGNIYLILLCSMKLAITYRMKGELSEVFYLCCKYYQFAEDKKMTHLDVTGWLLSVWGEALAETGQLGEAFLKVRRGIELTESSEDILLIIWPRLCMSRILLMKNDLKGVEEIFFVLEEKMSGRRIPPYISNIVSALQGHLLLAQNKINSAIQWCELRHLSLEGNVNQLNEAGYIVFARILGAQKKYTESISILESLYNASERAGRVSKMIEIMILQVMILEADDRVEESSTILKRLLSLAEENGFFQTMLLEGPQFTRLLYEFSKNERVSPYLERLLLSLKDKGATQKAIDSKEPKSPFIEKLSERELDVLRLLAEGLSRQEISEKLFVSLHTVKTHLRNIYSKLGIHNSLQAINMAQSLGILDV